MEQIKGLIPGSWGIWLRLGPNISHRPSNISSQKKTDVALANRSALVRILVVCYEWPSVSSHQMTPGVIICALNHSTTATLFFTLPTETLSRASQALVCKGRIIQGTMASIEGSTFDFALRRGGQARPLGPRAWMKPLIKSCSKTTLRRRRSALCQNRNHTTFTRHYTGESTWSLASGRVLGFIDGRQAIPVVATLRPYPKPGR